MDLDADEARFVEDSKLPRAACPSPDLVLAARAGLLPEDAGRSVQQHVARCALCQALASDLAEPEFSAPTPEEEARIRARVFGHAGPLRQARWFWWLAPIAAALLAAAGVALWTARSHPPALALEKPAVRLPAATALLWRGGAGDQQYLADLGEALAPYRANNYDEAARRLAALAGRYPTSAEARLYLGVSRLFLGRNAEAVAPLRRAGELGKTPLARDAGWYLAVAYARSGKSAEAAAELRKLCASQGEHQAEACAALPR